MPIAPKERNATGRIMLDQECAADPSIMADESASKPSRLLEDLRAKFACCRKKPLQMGGAEDCPSEGMKHRETVLCSPEKSCPPAQQCVRRRYQRNGFCCAMPYEQTGFYPDVMDSNCEREVDIYSQF
ncbi:unnamed protein product [Heligmosomoides polygyrus]|uniref:Thyroglobulin type-1 domain-containing protein n=1 Tax=Heligmosomoides polygyrus TaxID=6339 RepID=A0A183F9W6_HELPZ|nr:unnamed protein product [Heligmosomoides polygyrus]